MSDEPAARLSERYELLFKLASGGMGSVFVGRARGALGFRQLVAIKLPHPHMLEDPNVRTILVNEARVASSIRHANVVPVRDVEVAGEQVLLVMDYVEGGALSELMVASKEVLDPRLSLRIVLDACAGLQAAHEATDDRGRALDVVHRDVSPQNILVGLDGLARVTDFGVAKCIAEREASSGSGVKGKLAYMAPEYLRGGQVTKKIDVFGLGVVLWELLAGERLFRASNDGDTLDRVLHAEARPLGLSPELDAVIARALVKDPRHRFESAEAFGDALTLAAGARIASHREVGAFARSVFVAKLERVRERVSRMPSAIVTPISADALHASANAKAEAGPGPHDSGTRADRAHALDPGRTESLAREPRPLGPSGPMLGKTAPMLDAPSMPKAQSLTPQQLPAGETALFEGTETVLGSEIVPMAGFLPAKKGAWALVGVAVFAVLAIAGTLAFGPRLLARSTLSTSMGSATPEGLFAAPDAPDAATLAPLDPPAPPSPSTPPRASAGASAVHAPGPAKSGAAPRRTTPDTPQSATAPPPPPVVPVAPAPPSPSTSARRNPYLTP